MITMDWGMMMENRFNINMKNIEAKGTWALGAASATDYACAMMRKSEKARNVYQLFNNEILTFKTNGYTVTIQRTGDIQPSEEWFGTLYNVPALVSISGKDGKYQYNEVFNDLLENDDIVYMVNKYMANQRSRKKA